jgi:hypothetical protein
MRDGTATTRAPASIPSPLRTRTKPLIAAVPGSEHGAYPSLII